MKGNCFYCGGKARKGEQKYTSFCSHGCYSNNKYKIKQTRKELHDVKMQKEKLLNKENVLMKILHDAEGYE